MHYKIIGETQWKVYDSIIKIKVSPLGTTTPAGTLIADGDFAYRNSINGTPILDAFTNDGACKLLIFEKITTIATFSASSRMVCPSSAEYDTE